MQAAGRDIVALERTLAVVIVALLALPNLSGPADAEDGLTFDQGAHYIMLPACEIAKIMRYEKVDGEWTGGRSILKGELPVTGYLSARLASSEIYIFDAHRLRMRTEQLVGAAKVVKVEGFLSPDRMPPDFFLAMVDGMVKTLMAEFDSDPLSNCDLYRAIDAQEQAEFWERYRESR